MPEIVTAFSQDEDTRTQRHAFVTAALHIARNCELKAPVLMLAMTELLCIYYTAQAVNHDPKELIKYVEAVLKEIEDRHLLATTTAKGNA